MDCRHRRPAPSAGAGVPTNQAGCSPFFRFQHRLFAFLVCTIASCARRQSGEAGRGAGRCLEVHAQVLCESDMTYGSSRARSVTKRICRSSCWLARLGRMEEDVSRVFDKSGTAEPPTPVARALLSHWLNSTAARWEVPRAAWSMAVRLSVRVGRRAQRSAGQTKRCAPVSGGVRVEVECV